MRAIIASSDGPVLTDIPQPSPGQDEVLVRVTASSLNRADLLMLKGAYHGGFGGTGFPLGPDWVEQVLKATGGNGVDLLIDLVAGPFVNGNLKATRLGGRMVNVGRLAGEQGEFDFNLHSLRRITYVGVTFRTRSPQEVEEVVARTTRALGPALTEGALRLPIDTIYRFEEASGAFERMAQNQHFGKIILANA